MANFLAYSVLVTNAKKREQSRLFASASHTSCWIRDECAHSAGKSRYCILIDEMDLTFVECQINQYDFVENVIKEENTIA